MLGVITTQGASFFDELAGASGLLGAQVEDALGELVAQGLVNCDSFAGLRALLVPSPQRRTPGARKRVRRSALFGIEDAGRWALARRAAPAPAASSAAHAPGAPLAAPDDNPQIVEHVVRALLKRYGVVFWRLVAREASWLPPWRELLRCLRRLEARGEIRGGRFVSGLSGEQFALPEAIGSLRETRRRALDGVWISLSGADPLNLAGVVTPGARLPALTGNRILYRDGIPVALRVAGEVRWLLDLPPAEQWAAQNALQRRQVPAALRVLG